MKRTAWLQDRRMQKFRDVLSLWERGDLSMLEAGELLGVSERQFRRYRDQYEERGLDGLIDRRLGKVSPARVPAAELRTMLDVYRGPYRGWNAKQAVPGAERLGIGHIAACSPKARGRSERMFGTLQNRLIGELALMPFRWAAITGIAAANAWIKDVDLSAHNARFTWRPSLTTTARAIIGDTRVGTKKRPPDRTQKQGRSTERQANRPGLTAIAAGAAAASDPAMPPTKRTNDLLQKSDNCKATDSVACR